MYGSRRPITPDDGLTCAELISSVVRSIRRSCARLTAVMANSWHENEPAPEGLSDVDRRVREALDALGVEYTAVACDPALADTAAFCAAYGYDTGDSANTILVQTR